MIPGLATPLSQMLFLISVVFHRTAEFSLRTPHAPHAHTRTGPRSEADERSYVIFTKHRYSVGARVKFLFGVAKNRGFHSSEICTVVGTPNAYHVQGHLEDASYTWLHLIFTTF